MSRGTQIERLARLEEKVAIMAERLDENSAKLDTIHDYVTAQKATVQTVKTGGRAGLAILKGLYPPVAAAAAYAAMHFGLPRA